MAEETKPTPAAEPAPAAPVPAAQQPCPVTEAREPKDAARHGACGEDPPRPTVGAGDRPEKEHGVEVHVGVEPREGEGRRGGHADGRPGGDGTSGASGRGRIVRLQRLPRGPPCPPSSKRGIDEQERRARPAGAGLEPRPSRHRHPQPRDSRRNQHHIRGGADPDYHPDVFAPQPLPQHEDVLCSNGDDEREPEPEAREERHGATLGASPR